MPTPNSEASVLARLCQHGLRHNHFADPAWFAGAPDYVAHFWILADLGLADEYLVEGVRFVLDLDEQQLHPDLAGQRWLDLLDSAAHPIVRLHPNPITEPK